MDLSIFKFQKGKWIKTQELNFHPSTAYKDKILVGRRNESDLIIGYWNNNRFEVNFTVKDEYTKLKSRYDSFDVLGDLIVLSPSNQEIKRRFDQFQKVCYLPKVLIEMTIQFLF